MIGDPVEVEARLAYTGRTSLNIAVELRSGDLEANGLETTSECAVVMVSVDSPGRPVEVEPCQADDVAGISLVARVKQSPAGQQLDRPHQ